MYAQVLLVEWLPGPREAFRNRKCKNPAQFAAQAGDGSGRNPLPDSRLKHNLQNRLVRPVHPLLCQMAEGADGLLNIALD